MGYIHINYRQMLAAKQVYSDTYEDVIDAVYKECGPSGVSQVIEFGAQLIVKCEYTGEVRRLADRDNIVVRFDDILSVIVVTESTSFVVDSLAEGKVLITVLNKTCQGPMGALILSPSTYGLGHIRVAGIYLPAKKEN